MKTYITRSGDTWDMIAREVYGSESYTSLLMENNQSLIDYFIFPQGVTLDIVPVPNETGNLPEWRT